MQGKINTYKVSFLLVQKKLLEEAKSFVNLHVVELEIFLLAFIVLSMLSRLPFINILLESYVRYFIIIVLGTYLFRIPKQLITGLIVSLFAISLFLTLLNKDSSAEAIGNLIYFLLWFDCLLYFKDIWQQD